MGELIVDAVAPGLLVDYEKHTYKSAKDGRRLLSATEILGMVGMTDYSGLNPRKVEEYLYRGRWVHAHAALIVQGKRDRQNLALAQDWGGYLAAVEKFIKDAKAEFRLVECAVYDEVLGVAGRLDFTLVLEGAPCVLDLKLTEAQRATAIQNMIYARCLPSLRSVYDLAHMRHERFALPLSKDGRYGKLEWYNDARDTDLMMSAINVARWIQNGKQPRAT